MGLIDIIKTGTFVDILRGMSVTGGYFVGDKVTIEYPWEKAQTYPRFRGAHALISDPQTGDAKCVACMLCATICPSGCIHITGEVTPDGRSRPATFDLDLSRCVYCGLCEEVCPEAAIVMTSVYELATFNKDEFWLTKERLLANQQNARKEVFVLADAEGEAPLPLSAARGARGAGLPLDPAAQQALYEAEPARRPRPDVDVPAASKPADPTELPAGMAEGRRIIAKVASRRKGMLP
jgi:NADH-quinone oxidoreductase subunit I